MPRLICCDVVRVWIARCRMRGEQWRGVRCGALFESELGWQLVPQEGLSAAMALACSTGCAARGCVGCSWQVQSGCHV
jgi:hypothetical protein